MEKNLHISFVALTTAIFVVIAMIAFGKPFPIVTAGEASVNSVEQRCANATWPYIPAECLTRVPPKYVTDAQGLAS